VFHHVSLAVLLGERPHASGLATGQADRYQLEISTPQGAALDG
jgi:hypothetical protein